MKFLQYFQVIHEFGDVVKRVSPHFFGADAFQDCFSFFGFVPEIGLVRDQFFVFYFKALTIVVKDTPSRR
jgi:hypothetical protein